MARIPIPLPRLGEGVASAEVISWLVETGTSVTRGQDLAEVQTPKAVLEVAAPADGVLSEHVANAGDEVDVGSVIGWLTTDGDDEIDASGDSADTSASSPATLGELDSVTAGSAPVTGGTMAHSGFLSPRVRARMDELGLDAADLAVIPGSGRGGRVTSGDVDQFIDELENLEVLDASPMRRAVADGMRRSWTRPLATVARAFSLDAVLAHRRTVAGRPSLTLYSARALALALSEDRRLCRRLVGSRLYEPKRLHIAIAAEADDGILLPLLLDADEHDLAALTERHAHALDDGHAHSHGERAAATVTNYGSLNLTWAMPIPPAGQSCILGVGMPKVVPVWDPAERCWGRGKSCELTLTFDHRVADGSHAARLLHRVAALLEKPELLVD
ncbi:MAG: 2-oxo acid dehydrogenase subunit E2 [Planctomycetota bacterium]|jgi:pyruvate/2-oxoglutarate dehydrogenase complex dihydrolipoamide acyltransferase (E2) component